MKALQKMKSQINLKKIIEKTINFDFPIKKTIIFSFELFHGPSLAFKDVERLF